MNLTGYYNEEVLNTMLKDGEINHLEYIFHHSPEMKEDFEQYCRDNGKNQDNDAANAYFVNLMEKTAEEYDIDAEEEYPLTIE